MNKILTDLKKELKMNLGVEGHEIVQEPVEVLTEDESASAEAIETIGDIAEVNELNNTAEDLNTVVEGGDELVAAVESAIAMGKGLSPIESVALKRALTHLSGKYSSVPADLVPGRESFGGTADSYETTVLAHEGLKDSFDTFWEATKAQFLKVIEAIQKIFRAIVQKFTSVNKRALALKARVTDDPIDAESENATIEINPTNLRLSNNVAEVGNEVPEGLNRILDVVSSLLKNTRGVDDRAEVNKGVDSLKDTNVWADYVNGVNNNAKRTFDSIQHRDDTTTVMLPGLKYISFNAAQPNSRDQFAYEALEGFDDGEKPKDATSSVKVLTGKQIVATCDLVVLIAEEIEKFDKVWSRSSSKAARLVQGINVAVKASTSKLDETESDEDPAVKQEKESRMSAFKVNVSSLINHVRRLDKFSSELVTYAQLTSNDALAFGEKSLEAIRATAQTAKE